jgi:hypothetical protein
LRSTESLGYAITTPGRWTSSTKRSRTAMRSSGVKSTNGLYLGFSAWHCVRRAPSQLVHVPSKKSVIAGQYGK